MASLFPNRESADRPQSRDRARILLLNKDLRDLVRYRAILQRLGCQVQASSSFADGVQWLWREPFDLILLDQGSGRFEGRDVLVQAMEIEPELRVLVLAQSYDRGCYLEAMQSGALDYVERPLSASEIVALLDMFTACRSSVLVTSVNRVANERLIRTH